MKSGKNPDEEEYEDEDDEWTYEYESWDEGDDDNLDDANMDTSFILDLPKEKQAEKSPSKEQEKDSTNNKENEVKHDSNQNSLDLTKKNAKIEEKGGEKTDSKEKPAPVLSPSEENNKSESGGKIQKNDVDSPKTTENESKSKKSESGQKKVLPKIPPKIPSKTAPKIPPKLKSEERTVKNANNKEHVNEVHNPPKLKENIKSDKKEVEKKQMDKDEKKQNSTNSTSKGTEKKDSNSNLTKSSKAEKESQRKAVTTANQTPLVDNKWQISGRSLGRMPMTSKGGTNKSQERARSASPIKPVRELRKVFGNTNVPPLVINNVPRGNILVKFGISQHLPNAPPPPPPPKKEFKWKLPEVSAATKATYFKPTLKPTVYKSSAPEFRDNPLIIEPIFNIETNDQQLAIPDERIVPQKPKESEDTRKQTQKVGEKRGRKPEPKEETKKKNETKPDVKKQKVPPEVKPKLKKENVPPKSKSQPQTKKEVKPMPKKEGKTMPKKEVKPMPKKEPKTSQQKAQKSEVAAKPKSNETNKKEEKTKVKDSEKEKDVEEKEIKGDTVQEEKDKEKEKEKSNAGECEDEEYYYEEIDEEIADEEKEEELVENNEDGTIEENVEDLEEEDKEDEISEEMEDMEDVEDEDEKQSEHKRRRNKKGKGKKRSKKEREIRKSKLKEKRRWVPPPRPPPELIEMPPEIKRLYEILREENIRPTIRYSKKKKRDVEIPFTIPWENTAALQTQSGMGAFGKQRDPNIKVNDGEMKLNEGSLKSESTLRLFEESLKSLASQKGLGPFGCHRRNVQNVVDSHEYESSDKLSLSETIIPKLMQGLIHSQSEITPIGSNRPQVTKIIYMGEEGGCVCEKESNAFISRQFKPVSSLAAGSCVIDRRRNVISFVEGIGEMKCDQMSRGIIPRMFSTDLIYTKTGADFGAFRPLVTDIEGGNDYKMSYEKEVLCKLVVPFQTAPSYNP